MTAAPAAARSRFLDLPALAALSRLRFAPRQRIEGAFAGRHRSRRLGGAGEFADYREYVEGDDLRHLDWKALARSGRAYLKLYQDETNLICTLALDASRSMAFPPKASKLEYTQYLATAFSHVIPQQQDQVGTAILGDGLKAYIPPGGAPDHVLQVQEAIEKLAVRPRTELAGGLRDLFLRQRRRGVLMLMSDFLVEDMEAVVAALRLFRHRQWEVLLLHIIHPLEERLPEGASFRFEGLEGEGIADATPEEVRAAYEQRFAAHAAMVRSLALAAGCGYRRVSTAVPYLQTLGAFLVERMG